MFFYRKTVCEKLEKFMQSCQMVIRTHQDAILNQIFGLLTNYVVLYH